MPSNPVVRGMNDAARSARREPGGDTRCFTTPNDL